MAPIPSTFRRVALYCFTLCFVGLGPAVLAALPNTLNWGTEEETRCAVAHVASGAPVAKCRASGTVSKTGRSHRGQPEHGQSSTYRCASRRATMTLCEMRVRLQV